MPDDTFGLNFDPSHLVWLGIDYIKAAKDFAARIFHVHAKDAEILKEEYIPFGTQYYRAPSPMTEKWKRDLKNIAGLGMNIVKFWVQWRWNHPEEHTFYFDDIDRLMDIAARYKLKVMLNTIFDVAPAWIYRKYPDASMVTLDGRRISPQTQPHRQIGGLGYCFNHDGVMEHFFHFLQTTIQRYKDHPALAIWNVGSEPELTSSMHEMRDYADDSDQIGDMLCYCENCTTTFKTWLQEKYKSIDQLNQAWNRNYSSFDDVEVPVTRNTFNDMIDWRMFFVHTLGKNVKKRFEVARDIDQGRHPLMCHHVFIQGFPVISTANDPWNVGQYGDLHGFTQMDDGMMIDVLRSCARNKPVISAEMLMLPGYTLDLPAKIDVHDVKKFIFSSIAGNLKGFVFWQYRPEILGREAPTWGLSFLDGGATEWLKNKNFSELKKYVEKHTHNVVKHYGDKVQQWEVVNEYHDWANVHNHTPEQITEIVRLACDETHAANPNVVRILNNTLPWAEYAAWGRMAHQEDPAARPLRSPRQFIQDLTDAGVDYDVLGVQVYFPERDLSDIVRMLERFEKFGKPMYITEIGATSGPTKQTTIDDKMPPSHQPYAWHRHWDEELQADWLEQVYTLFYSRQLIKAINWYDYADFRTFIPNGGLVTKDCTPKRSYNRLEKLLASWDCLPEDGAE